MEINKINEELRRECPGKFILQSFCQIERKLVVAFTCGGGPKEDYAYLITFNEAIIFHLPSVLYKPIRFKIAEKEKIKEIIPSISYDEGEYCETGYKVVTIIDGNNKETGYYLAADSVSAEWVSRDKCIKVW